MPPKVERERIPFYDVVQILRGKSAARDDVQKEQVKRTIDYLTSVRNYGLYTDDPTINPPEDFERVSSRWCKLTTLVQRGCLKEFGFTTENYINPLQERIAKLHKVQKLKDKEKEELVNFLYTYQTSLNSGLGESS